MEKVVAVGFVDQDSFISSLMDFGQVFIKKIADGRLGIYCSYSLTDNQAAFIDSRETAVDHWPMPEISRPDLNNRFQNPNDGSIILELKSIRHEIQQELFKLLGEQLQKKGYELEYDN